MDIHLNPLSYTDQIAAYKTTGQLFGDLFRYFWSNREYEFGKELYVYPDSSLDIIDPEFDELVLPIANYDPYPTFVKVY